MEPLNFVTHKRNCLDYLKYAIFMYGPSIILSVVYLAGRTHIGLLGVGYLIAYFFFLWFGQDFTTKYNMTIIRLWNYLIFYCCIVMCIKIFLQIIVTGFHRQLISCKATSSVNIFCIFIQLLLSCSTLELKSNKCYAFSTNFNERVDRILVDADFSM
ncbi:unnamed protein product [Rotaria sp. Silwood1]|nr:unnamed protein product [Rotaria sp. Silwood1]